MGYNSTDQVFLDSAKQTGVKDFLWFLATDQRGVPVESDGIMGLCRRYETKNYVTGPLVVEAMKDAVRLCQILAGKLYAAQILTFLSNLG